MLYVFISIVYVCTSVGNWLKFHDRSSVVRNQPMINQLKMATIRYQTFVYKNDQCIVKCIHKALKRTQMFRVSDCQL